VSTSAPDVAILVETGYLAAALRAGGYRAPIIGIEHGSILQSQSLGRVKRLIRAADRVSGTKACSVVVAVSDYVRERLIARRPHRRVVCIPNGVDLTRFSPLEGATHGEGGQIIIGCAARLVEGKGIEDLITSFSHSSLDGARLRIAGDGPRAPALKALARSLGVASRVEFLGRVLDMPAFWQSTDIAVVPSNGAVESFGMAAIEAMACGKAVVVSDSGALPSAVVDGECGRVVRAGDIVAMRRAIAEYAHDPARRVRHGSCGRRRCEEHFAIERTASRYLELCAELVREAAQMRRS
jgi:glycosyltransferase involved in cell wall biosynthesis